MLSPIELIDGLGDVGDQFAVGAHLLDAALDDGLEDIFYPGPRQILENRLSVRTRAELSTLPRATPRRP
jgi:hypothetical protein